MFDIWDGSEFPHRTSGISLYLRFKGMKEDVDQWIITADADMKSVPTFLTEVSDTYV